MSGHRLKLDNVSKFFTTAEGQVTAVDAVNFTIEGSEFFTMLGPSGCGKTTTLRMIAGLEAPSAGRILFDGRDLSRSSAFARNVGMVFQSYALFPHMTVFENISYGLRIRRFGEAEIRARVDRTMGLLGLGGLTGRYPADLSGGQQQRVSIARALVYEPGMLLLDEPLANLDAKLRVDMREEIRRLQKELEILLIYVTHDQEEAMSVSDRIAVFEHGRLRQIGRPEEIYADPASLFVADFIGRANFFPARMVASDGRLAVGGVERRVVRGMEHGGREGRVMVRPEHVRLLPAGSGGFACTIRRVQFLGSFVRYGVACAALGGDVLVEATRPIAGLTEGALASCDFDGEDAIFYGDGGCEGGGRRAGNGVPVRLAQ